MYSHRISDAFLSDDPVVYVRKLLQLAKERAFFWDQLEYEQRIYARVVQVIMSRIAEFRYMGALRRYYRVTRG